MKSILLFATLFLLTITAWAQAPFETNYQAVIRDNNGIALSDSTPVAIRFTIHDTTATGAVEYTETQNTITNKYGMVSVQIGSVTSLSGIDWSTSQKWLEVQVSINGAGYVTMGTSQLVSVPYALYAAKSGNTAPRVSFSAYASNSQSLTAFSPIEIIFDMKEYDNGGNFSANQFTAPADGLYNFSSGIRFTGATAGKYLWIGFQLNNNIHNDATFQTSADFFGANISSDLSLHAGDIVNVVVYSNIAENTVGSNFNVWFMGHQVY